MKIAVYPGTFDPITYGHIDVIKKSLKIFDKLVIATSDNNDKNYLFSIEERIDIINNSLFNLMLTFPNVWIEILRSCNFLFSVWQILFFTKYILYYNIDLYIL